MDINIGAFRWDLILSSKDYLDKTGKLFLYKSNSLDTIITASQAETGFVIIPLISSILNLDVNFIKNFLFVLLTLITLILSFYSSFKFSLNLKTKIFSIIFFSILISLSYPLYISKYAEYSIHYFFSILAIYPIYLTSKEKLNSNKILLYLFLFSIIAIIYGLMRDYSYLNLLIMFGYIVLFKIKENKFYKIFCIIILISPIFVNNIIAKNTSIIMNKNFSEIAKNNSNIISHNEDILLGQSVWHSLYASLGFLNNDIVKGRDGYDDDIIRDVFNRDPLIDYHFYVSDDNKILTELKNIFFENPIFIFKTFFAKLGIIFGYFLLIANIGIFIFKNNFYFKNKEKVNLLLLNFLLASLFPLVAVPSKVYMGGVISSSFLILYFFILSLINTKSK